MSLSKLKGSATLLAIFVSLLVVSTVAAADCNGNGVDDLKDIAEGNSADCNLNGTPDECEGSPLIFGLRPGDVQVGIGPTSITSGDVDGDGFMDLVTANNDDDNVSVLLNDGDGGFDPVANFSVGDAPQVVVTGDFNLDGRLDLATVNRRSADVSILLGEGNGDFLEAVHVAVSYTHLTLPPTPYV